MMNRLEIYGSPVLRTPPPPIKDFDGRLRAQAHRMRQQMRRFNGVGLAATQVGYFGRLFVWAFESQAGEVANPVITQRSDELDMANEGCLSIPGLWAPVPRAKTVTLTGQNLDGEPFTLDAEGTVARIFQHEVDHLAGKMFIDRTTGSVRAKVFEEIRDVDAQAVAR